jgi:hypothetical protein
VWLHHKIEEKKKARVHHIGINPLRLKFSLQILTSFLVTSKSCPMSSVLTRPAFVKFSNSTYKIQTQRVKIIIFEMLHFCVLGETLNPKQSSLRPNLPVPQLNASEQAVQTVCYT